MPKGVGPQSEFFLYLERMRPAKWWGEKSRKVQSVGWLEDDNGTFRTKICEYIRIRGRGWAGIVHAGSSFRFGKAPNPYVDIYLCRSDDPGGSL